MRLKIDQGIKNFNGKEITLEDKDKTVLTFRTVIENSINMQTDANPLTSEKKLRAFQIGVKLNTKKLSEYELTVDQIAFVKERIGLFYSPIIYGRFLELIQDEVVKPEPNEIESVPQPKKK